MADETVTAEKTEAEKPKRKKIDLIELGDRVVELKDNQGLKWNEVVEAIPEAGSGRIQLAYMIATTLEEDQIKWESEDDLAPQVVEARNAGQSWGQITARTRPLVAETKVRALFEKTTETSAKGHRIGKGGRWPKGQEPEGSGEPKNSEGGATAKVTSGKPVKGKHITEYTEDELKGRLAGKTVTYETENGNQKVAVTEVRSLKDGAVEVVVDNGNVRTLSLENIKRVSR